jgi:hypothetical protein
MQLLLSRAGLVLNPGQVADLVLAWRQVAGLIASIPRERPLADDMALTFRLPAPPTGTPLVTRRPAPLPAKPKAKAKTKARAAPKRRNSAKPVSRKRTRRGQ